MVCVVYSCMGVYYVAKDYYNLDSEERSECYPYLAWKTGFLFHIIFFFICVSFSVGAAQTYLNEEDIENNRINQRVDSYREKFEKVLDSAMDVVRGFCMLFCGPFILCECLLSMFFYYNITSGCPYLEDSLSGILIYVLIILGCISLIVTGFFCYMLVLFGKSVKDVYP